MNYLLDTHFLVWLATDSKNLSRDAREIISEAKNQFWFSAASLWEAAIKSALKRPDFMLDVAVLRAGLLANGFKELSVHGPHLIVFRDLLPIHKDPFDRLLVAQARAEGLMLLTVDENLRGYGTNVKVIPKG